MAPKTPIKALENLASLHFVPPRVLPTGSCERFRKFGKFTFCSPQGSTGSVDVKSSVRSFEKVLQGYILFSQGSTGSCDVKWRCQVDKLQAWPCHLNSYSSASAIRFTRRRTFKKSANRTTIMRQYLLGSTM